MNFALSSLYKEGFFICAQRARQIASCWLLFLQKYTDAASFVYRSGLSRFALVPKVHYLHHGAIRLLREAERGLEEGGCGWAINPMSESVQVQEDFIGRPARLSRRVCPKRTHLRVLQRSLINTAKALKQADKDQRGLFCGR